MLNERAAAHTTSGTRHGQETAEPHCHTESQIDLVSHPRTHDHNTRTHVGTDTSHEAAHSSEWRHGVRTNHSAASLRPSVKCVCATCRTTAGACRKRRHISHPACSRLTVADVQFCLPPSPPIPSPAPDRSKPSRRATLTLRRLPSAFEACRPNAPRLPSEPKRPLTCGSKRGCSLMEAD